MSSLPLALLSLWSVATDRLQASAPPPPQEATPVVDHLHHPAGTVTGRAGVAHVERRGKGPVLLLLIAGAPFGWHAWEGFMARNEERYTMLAVTPAGYEGTPPPAMPAAEHEDYTERPWTDALMADMVALIEKERSATTGLGTPVVLGHHLMGDYYAVRLAYEHPDLVRGVVSVSGMGSAPVGNGPVSLEARARYVNGNRAPFFRAVSQENWNAGTFPARSLSRDAERGRRLFEAEVAVPIATQVRYYLEYMTDELEQGLEFLQCPLLALQAPPAFGFDSLSASMKEQLLKRFGTLEEAKKQVHFGGPWDTLAVKTPPGLVEVREIAGTGAFLMDDAPQAFDAALAGFVARLAAKARPAASPKQGK